MTHRQKYHTSRTCDFTYVRLRTLVHTKGQYHVNVHLRVPVHTKRPYLAYLQLLIPGQYCENMHLSVVVLILPEVFKTQLLCFLHWNSPGDSGNDGHTNRRTSLLYYNVG